MCLDKLENFEVTQNHGWQVFVKQAGCLYPYHFGDSPVPVRKWQRDKFRMPGENRWVYIDYLSGPRYRKGYHIFLNEEDARTYCPISETYCIRKVRFKKILARGLQEISADDEGGTRRVRVVVCHKRFVERS